MPKTSWTPRNIYLYLVCLITLIMIIFGTFISITNIVDLFLQSPGYTYDTISIIQEYQRIKEDINLEDISFEDFKNMKQQDQDREMKRQKYYNIRELAESLSVILVALPFFIYHWRKIQQEKETN